MRTLIRFASTASLMLCCALTMGDVILWSTGSAVESIIAKNLRERAIQLQTANQNDLSSTTALDLGRSHTWILAKTSRFPADALAAVQRHLAAGGELLVLGDAPFEELTHQHDGKWLTQQEYLRKITKPTSLFPLIKVENCAITTDFGAGQNQLSLASEQLPDAPGGLTEALRMQIPELHSWCTFRTQAPEIMPDGDLTTFWAKGTTATKKLAIEWQEHDGSRWIATVDLTPEWQYYVLEPQDFEFWIDNISRGRGGRGDKVNLQNVQEFAVGLAQTHTKLNEGPHEFWIANAGTSKSDGTIKSLLTEGEIDGLYPQNKTYPMNPKSVELNQVYTAPTTALPVPEKAWSAYWRPMGSGIDKNRRHRFIPVATAHNKDGTRAGTVASMTLHFDNPTSGAITGSIGIPNPDVLTTDAWMNVAAQMIEKMQHRLFFAEAGATEFCYDVRDLKAQPITVGFSLIPSSLAMVTNIADVLTTISGISGNHKRGTGFQPMNRSTLNLSELPDPPADLSTLTYEAGLYLSGKLVDYISQEIRFDKLREGPPQFVTARDRKFWKGEKPWRAFGINYMPSSGLALFSGTEFEHWIEDPSYDPDIVQADLERIKSLGFNMVSVFAYSRDNTRLNLLDLLHRCRELGLMVNLSLRPNSNPWPAKKAVTDRLVKEIRAWERDEIMGYDIAWEPWWGNADRRMHYSDRWINWVTREYGSAQAATESWNFATQPLTDFPSDHHLNTDGPWRVAVKDYRRFVHTALNAAYKETRDNIRAIDPNHLVSFRQSEGGNPLVSPSSFPVELAPIADAVDFFSPEGYGIGDSPEKAKTFWFTTAYAQGLAPGKPVMLAEYGASVWSGSVFNPDAMLYQRQANTYENIFQAAEASRAAGTVQWWYPGGYRRGEESDFGLLNPDGTDRPATKVVRKWADRMKQYPADIVWQEPITGNANGVRGYVGLYENLKNQFYDKATTGSFPVVKRAQKKPPPPTREDGF